MLRCTRNTSTYKERAGLRCEICRSLTSLTLRASGWCVQGSRSQLCGWGAQGRRENSRPKARFVHRHVPREDRHPEVLALRH